MKVILLCCLLCAGFLEARAGQDQIGGTVVSKSGAVIPGVSVALLYPEDSTLAFFAVSGADGSFVIKSVKDGDYVLQVASMGYYTHYRKLHVASPSTAGIGWVVLEENETATMLKGVVISGEKVPLRIKGDTVEYNAGSYRVKPNAVAEDLLRQLPGMQVDEAGNIKAMGKSVNKVLVDGKEFFGNDPKVATKNLPADAIDKVQTYNKHSDRSEFTGIDDGQRNQTINLVLKDGKKQGYFGDVKAGAATGDHYEGRGKIFRFREQEQLAGLGMLNNINQFGFSIEDYLNFSVGSMGNPFGDRKIEISDAGNLPVNFGQPVTGDITSGALGINYSRELRKNNRFAVSYMGNGMRKLLGERFDSRNYLPGQDYRSADTASSRNSSYGNGLSFSWRNDIDSFRQLTMNLSAQFRQSRSSKNTSGQSLSDSLLINAQQGSSRNEGGNEGIVSSVGFVQKIRKGKWKVYQALADIDFSKRRTDNDLANTTIFYLPLSSRYSNQYRDQINTVFKANLFQSVVKDLGKSYFLEPSISAGIKYDHMNRSQGIAEVADGRIDSLSPVLSNNVYQLSPGISLKRSLSKLQWNAGVMAATVWLAPVSGNRHFSVNNYTYLLPSLSWRKDISSGKSLDLQYRSSIETPMAEMMLPVTDYSDPLYRVTGNPGLRPEYRHNMNMSYVHFDQFSMSSLFLSLNGSYTRDKIGYAITVKPDLSQDLLWVNMGYEAQLGAGAEYSTPLKPLGIEITLKANERLSRSLSPVNNVANRNTTLTHEFGLSLSSRQHKVFNWRTGASVIITDSRYSLNTALNNVYYQYTGFANLSWQLGLKWLFTVDGTLNYYAARSFNGNVTVPLVKAEISRYILPNQRGTVTLNCFDLLDRNVSLLRSSSGNTLTEQRANTIRRYLMCSFTYKLNKVGKTAPGIFGL